MYSYSDYLEALIHRNPIPMDQDDITYLNQFPRNYWVDAIKQRYNELLLQAVQGNMTNPATVNARAWKSDGLPGGKKTFQVNAGMEKLLQKLKGLGFDLSDPHPESGTLSNMKLMSREQAYKLVKNWIQHSHEQGSQELVPGFARYTPAKAERSINTPDDPNSKQHMDAWKSIGPEVQEMAQKLTQAFLQRLSRPDHPLHLNYYYWRERPQQITNDVVKRIHDNIANPNIEDRNFRYKLMQNYLSSIAQTGYATRRTLETAKKNGINVNDLISKGYNLQQIGDALKNSKFGKSFNITGEPQPQFKNPKQSINNTANLSAPAVKTYGNRTIANRRKSFNPPPEKSSYAMNPMSFKDWVHSRDC